ncbi:SRPBCC family protein [Plantactinospora sp. DSM 117369]
MDVNRNAPVIVELEPFTHAALSMVRDLHTTVDRRSDRNPYTERANLRGATFDWLAAGLEITSTIGELVPQRRIARDRRTHGIDGLHLRLGTFTPRPEGVLDRTEESWDGEPVRADPTNLRTAPESPLRDWLSALKKTAETTNLPQGGSA